jgi:multidrug efflux system outer membrane protein
MRDGVTDMRVLPIILLLLAAGCAPLGPDYQRPKLDNPAAFRSAEAAAADLANTRWWEQFGDPALDDLIAEALAGNLDLRIAAARVDEYAGRLAVARSGLYPQIGYQGGVSRDRGSERLATPVPSGIANPQTTDTAVLNASWEIDLWGRLRRLDEAARADLLASEEGRRGVILSLVASVANGYIALRDLDRQLEIARQTARSREAALRLFELQHQGGVVSLLEVSQVRSEHEAANAQVIALEQAVAQAEHALSYLLGRSPGPIRRGRTIDELAYVAVPAGLPSDLLERRPDIRQAEQDLVAANARIGAARALYYPTISLTGLLGVASEELGKLFSGPARTWSFAGGLAGPLFTFGAVEGQVEQAEARQRQLLAAYQQSIRTAFREVDDALVEQRKARERAETQARQVAALRDYARLARLRYENGYTSYLEVLDAERGLFNVELQYTQTRGDAFTALVNVYKAMGGGWVETLDRGMHPPRPASPDRSAAR